MQASWFEMLAQQAMTVPIYHSDLFPPSPYYRFFRVLTGYHKPNLSVELGVCGGGGSLHMALGHPEGTVVGVDHDWFQWPDAIKHLEETCPNFIKWNGDSVLSAKDIHTKFGRVDLLFIDTIHCFEETMMEYNAWKPYLSKRAIVCLDDLFRPGMDKAWAEMPEPKLRLDILHNGSPGVGGGFGVVWND